MLRSLMAAALFATAWLTSAEAFELVPVVQDFTPTGAGSTQTFGIVNNAAEPVAVQVSVARRNVALDGTETLVPAEQEFLVYPPQAVVAPGRVQVVQVRWLGDRAPTQEQPFRLVAEQLPINLEEARPQPLGGVVNVLLRYEGAIYVVPPGVRPEIKLDTVARVETAQGPRLAVTLANSGKSHGIVETAELSVRGRDADGRAATVNLTEDALGGLLGANVQANSRRQFLLDWPAALGTGEVSATIKAEVAR